MGLFLAAAGGEKIVRANLRIVHQNHRDNAEVWGSSPHRSINFGAGFRFAQSYPQGNFFIFWYN
ncbi:MAG: hypothetical protein COY73_02705 [Candidatus Nealsonbacteria bacterium CG_4_10_14_0_8_um_filter_37_14]|uniref:Uncharacterized protein n=1 Tax=Candidatus Nealsonbacteria bacterium CG_4_10_14_0_8_um_filter_37_14 TaxID=1974684 RepID=A0A2M7R6F1_9BACT|nr:MAG: hypothetical protein COY73_02705 [Candidatus Nealsonbacteria bacterium CG_4_10_14_0_8_um_filter_37_14]